MQITEITVKMGMTQNLGDYTNCRPEIELRATLNEGDDPDIELNDLVAETRRRLHAIVDDELEAAGREVKYFTGALFRTVYSDVRQAIAVHLDAIALPAESNWKFGDMWQRSHNFPARMRLETATRAAAELADKTGYPVHIATTPDADLQLPPLPDAGPEPAWHAKGLRHALQALRLPEEHWNVAELDHVDEDYLRRLYHNNLEQEPLAFRLEVIRENRPWPQDPPEDVPMDDEDWEDDEDFEEDGDF
ncbi:MAG: hypothetical protein H6661_04130 [Ardenticatenaceae bacterium]|nr:hypothetical protein [Ardenticatenaceae bacterium]